MAKKRKRWKRILRKVILWLIILLLLAAAGFYAWSKLKAEYTIVYDSYNVTRGSISNSLSFSGNFQALNSKTYSASNSADVRTVYVQVGDDVREGQKLIRLSNGTTVTADFDGRVNALPVEEGDSVTAGSALIQVVDFTHMKISMRVDEYDIADVRPGLTCSVAATATEKKFTSTVHSVDYVSASSGNVAYYTAEVYVDVDEGIYPGMQATVSIPQEEASDVVILKEDALSFDRTNQAYVWMQSEDGTMEQVFVTTGVSNGNYVEITSGLEEGDIVYKEGEKETASQIGGLLSGLFGGQSFGGAGGFDLGSMGDFDPGSFSGSGFPGGRGGSGRGASGSGSDSGSGSRMPNMGGGGK